MQRPFAKLDDEVRFLGNRNEQRRADRAALGMVPAHQGLEADHHVVLDTHDGLVVQIERIVGQGLAQVLHQDAALFGPVLEVGGIEAELPAPAVLRDIERKVGAVDQVLAVDAVVGRDRDAHRRADGRALVADRIGLREHLDDLVGELAERAAIVHVGQDDLEFVAAQPADLALVEHDMMKPVGHLLEQFIACLMAERVVDLLEAVEIDHHHRAASLCRNVGGNERIEAL